MQEEGIEVGPSHEGTRVRCYEHVYGVSGAAGEYGGHVAPGDRARKKLDVRPHLGWPRVGEPSRRRHGGVRFLPLHPELVAGDPALLLNAREKGVEVAPLLRRWRAESSESHQGLVLL